MIRMKFNALYFTNIKNMYEKKYIAIVYMNMVYGKKSQGFSLRFKLLI